VVGCGFVFFFFFLIFLSFLSHHHWYNGTLSFLASPTMTITLAGPITALITNSFTTPSSQIYLIQLEIDPESTRLDWEPLVESLQLSVISLSTCISPSFIVNHSFMEIVIPNTTPNVAIEIENRKPWQKPILGVHFFQLGRAQEE